jgi:hypothetical protein
VENHSQIWKTWAATLNHWGLKSLAATILEALGPLNLLGAQVVYLGQPFLNTFLSNNHLNAFANLLEDPEATQAFISTLRKDDHGRGVPLEELPQ